MRDVCEGVGLDWGDAAVGVFVGVDVFGAKSARGDGDWCVVDVEWGWK